MGDKRRNATLQVVACILTLAVVLILWRHSGSPGPPSWTFQRQEYVLLHENSSSILPPYSVSDLYPDDRYRLIDLKDFRFILNEKSSCNSSKLLVVVLVHSDPRNVEKRRAIRETWGSELKTLFLVAVSKDVTVNARLVEESEEHHDILQGNFIDAYRNMTYKHVMGLKWVTYHCTSAKYILKTDDDVFVYPKALVHYLRNNLSPYGARRLILCQYHINGLVRRSYRSKWRVSYWEYPGRYYPPYCQGWAVLYSPDVVFQLYQESQSASYFWIDDVFVTGLMAERARIGRSGLDDLILDKDRLEALPFKAPYQDFFIFGPPDMSLVDIYSLWRIVKSWGQTAPES